jgi:hypothetical protein
MYSFIVLYFIINQIIIINNRNKIKFNLSSIKNDSCWSVIDNDFLVYHRPKKLNIATLNFVIFNISESTNIVSFSITVFVSDDF